MPASVVRLSTMVRKAREKRGWSIAVLAETAQVDDDQLYRLEAGKCDPPFSLVANLVRILGLPIDNAVFNQRVSKAVQASQANEEVQSDS